MNHDFLVKFAFDLFDSDGSGSIEKVEVYELVTMVYGKKDVDAKAKDILKTIDSDKSGTITLEEFRELEAKARCVSHILPLSRQCGG
jgi:Ca2+-binding EF-hand superfamily protein